MAFIMANKYLFGSNTHDKTTTNEKIDNIIQNVELNTIISAFICEPGEENTMLSWATFNDIPGFKMTSDKVEFFNSERSYGYPCSLSYEANLTINGKNVFVDSFGQSPNYEIVLYGPRGGFVLTEIYFSYSYEGKFEDIEKYTKLLYPDCCLEKTDRRIGIESNVYKLRDNLYLGVTTETMGNALGCKELFVQRRGSIS